MTRIASLALLVCAAAPGIHAQKVYVDYDRQADLKSFRTFRWYSTDDTAHPSDIVHSRIVNNVEYRLTQVGLVEVEQDPDLYVTYHTDRETDFQIDTRVFGYAYPSGFYWDPYWSWGGLVVSSNVYRYTKDTLILDIWNARTREMVWRGTIENALPPNALKAAKKIDRAVDKIVLAWRKKLAADRRRVTK